MWHLGMWISAERGGAGLMVGIDDLKGLFQPQGFCDSKEDRLPPPATAVQEDQGQGHPEQPPRRRCEMQEL